MLSREEHVLQERCDPKVDWEDRNICEEVCGSGGTEHGGSDSSDCPSAFNSGPDGELGQEVRLTANLGQLAVCHRPVAESHGNSDSLWLSQACDGVRLPALMGPIAATEGCALHFSWRSLRPRLCIGGVA